jgi:hypothetical protein
MPKAKESELLRVSRNSYDNLLFIKSQLEPKAKKVLSFDDVISFLVGMWNKKYDKRSKK